MDSFPRTEWTRRVVSGNCYRNHKAIKWEWGNQDLNVDCSYLSTELVKILSSGRTGIKDGGTTGETETSQNYIQYENTANTTNPERATGKKAVPYCLYLGNRADLKEKDKVPKP